MYLFILLILGLFVGSFLNVAIDRLPHKKTIIKGRSYCDYCQQKLDWFDLIPVFSFIFLKRKCRYCKGRLSFQYPIIEAITGVFFALSYLYAINLYALSSTPFVLTLIYAIIVSCSLLLIFMIDLKYGIIPDQISILLSGVSLLYLLFNSRDLILNNLLTALTSFLFFFLLIVITRGKGMGEGDAKFAFAIGLILGFPLALVSVYLAFLTGALVSSILILLGLKKIKKDTIPFGPFLSGCALLTYFWGNQILSFFIKLFNF